MAVRWEYEVTLGLWSALGAGNTGVIATIITEIEVGVETEVGGVAAAFGCAESWVVTVFAYHLCWWFVLAVGWEYEVTLGLWSAVGAGNTEVTAVIVAEIEFGVGASVTGCHTNAELGAVLVPRLAQGPTGARVVVVGKTAPARW